MQLEQALTGEQARILQRLRAEALFRGAGARLDAGGVLYLYGPYRRNGAHTAPSNVAFDASLRAANPDWGVRDAGDLDRLAQAAGFSPVVITQMPAENLVLAFTRDARSRSESQ